MAGPRVAAQRPRAQAEFSPYSYNWGADRRERHHRGQHHHCHADFQQCGEAMAAARAPTYQRHSHRCRRQHHAASPLHPSTPLDPPGRLLDCSQSNQLRVWLGPGFGRRYRYLYGDQLRRTRTLHGSGQSDEWRELLTLEREPVLPMAPVWLDFTSCTDRRVRIKAACNVVGSVIQRPATFTVTVGGSTATASLTAANFVYPVTDPEVPAEEIVMASTNVEPNAMRTAAQRFGCRMCLLCCLMAGSHGHRCLRTRFNYSRASSLSYDPTTGLIHQ